MNNHLKQFYDADGRLAIRRMSISTLGDDSASLRIYHLTDEGLWIYLYTNTQRDGLYMQDSSELLPPRDFSLHKYKLATERGNTAARLYARRKLEGLMK